MVAIPEVAHRGAKLGAVLLGGLQRDHGVLHRLRCNGLTLVEVRGPTGTMPGLRPRLTIGADGLAGRARGLKIGCSSI